MDTSILRFSFFWEFQILIPILPPSSTPIPPKKWKSQGRGMEAGKPCFPTKNGLKSPNFWLKFSKNLLRVVKIAFLSVFFGFKGVRCMLVWTRYNRYAVSENGFWKRTLGANFWRLNFSDIDWPSREIKTQTRRCEFTFSLKTRDLGDGLASFLVDT
jgi:hypothetical protein